MEHGQRILDFYSGKSDSAAMSPFDAKGNWTLMNDVNSPTAINAYGGFFDLLAAVGEKCFLSPTDDAYEFKHAFSAFFGALLIIFTGLLAYKITDDWRAALLTLIIAALTPRIVGHSLSNPKDIPFAAFFTFGLFLIAGFIKEFPRIKIWRATLLILAIGAAMSIRVGAVILVGYLFLFAAIFGVYLFLKKEIELKKLLQLAGITLAIGVLGYFCCSLFWPWAMKNPLENPWKALQLFRNFNAFDSIELFEGKWIHYNSIPQYFVPKMFYITMPLSITIGFVLFFILLPKIFRNTSVKILLYSLLIFSVLFPVITVVRNNSNIYDDARHLYFVLPSVIVLASSAWFHLLRNAHGFLFGTLLIFFSYTLYEPLSFMWRNHPLEVLYYSPLIGGTKGAFKNYELDYWGFSLRSGLEWIEGNASSFNENQKARVRLWYGEQLKIKNYCERSKKLQYVLVNENSTEWDYFLQLPAEAKFNSDLLFHWPPKGTVHEVTVDGAPVCAVIRNYRTGDENSTPVVANENAEQIPLQKGLQYYNAKNYNAAIIEFKKAIAAQPNSVVLYSNLAASFNNLGMFDDAIFYGNIGMKIDPNFQLLINNYKVSAEGKKTLQYSEKYFLNASYNYFMQKDFSNCIAASEMILKYNPKNAAAYNNICSAYNELKQYKKALDACNKGLELSPQDQILKNNRAVSQKGLNQ